MPPEDLEIYERMTIIPPLIVVGDAYSSRVAPRNLASIFRSRAALQLENLALRHQIGVLQRSAAKRPKLGGD